MIGGNVPKHLVVGSRQGFLTAMKAKVMPWMRVAMTMTMGAKSVDLVDLGAAPMPELDRGGQVRKDFIEKTIQVQPSDWSLTVGISHNAVMDDQTASLERKVRGAGGNFQKHINNRVFQFLNAGDGQTLGVCYDGQDFIDSDHVDSGAEYQTGQDNENALVLSIDNFETVWTAAQLFRDDQGEYQEYDYDLIVCHPDNMREAFNIVSNEWAYDTANREKNPFPGLITSPVITTPHFDTTAWQLIASGEAIKPIIVAMKEEPNLQHAWFEPEAAEGGMFWFKFFARYEMYYGDWRLVNQGNT